MVIVLTCETMRSRVVAEIVSKDQLVVYDSGLYYKFKRMLKSYHFLRHLHPPPHMSQLKRQFYQSDENPVTTLVVAESRK
ncbi:unnamed protein product [Prunus armeniaca]|uniref:Uncharacterized protein n=1 Tax=Prunus armeniaca TaxID=36596 RepID=A0A6J5VAI0_PRUAR|nr:unnamed protein product [Prunus armeniaca]